MRLERASNLLGISNFGFRISTLRPVLLGVGFLGLVAGAYFLGRFAGLPTAAAAAPGTDDPKTKTDSTTHHSSLTPHQDDQSRQVVAYLYNSIPITREDLGEYLIAR